MQRKIGKAGISVNAVARDPYGRTVRGWKLAGQQCERKASGLAANRLGSVGATVSASTRDTLDSVLE